MASSVPVTMAGIADGRWTEHQGGRRADRAGAPARSACGSSATASPSPRRTASGYRALRPPTTSRPCAARAPTASAGSPCAPRSSARARRGGASDHPSIYAAVAATDHGARPQVLRKSTLIALSRAIEHELLARARRAGRASAPSSASASTARVEPRYRRLARDADAATVFADFAAAAPAAGAPVEVPIAEGDALGNEWAVDRRRARLRRVPAGLGAARRDRARRPDDGDRRFEAIWTIDPRATRRAAQAAARAGGRRRRRLRAPARGAAGRPPAGAWSSRRRR